MPGIPQKLRALVMERAKETCEYCQAQKLIVVDMEIDHIQPETAGGTTTEENLCFVCSGCNTFKWKFQTGIDPETSEEHALFNPRIQQWTEHFRWNEDSTQIIGLTSIGRATIQRLKMNRSEVVNARRVWAITGLHPPKL